MSVADSLAHKSAEENLFRINLRNLHSICTDGENRDGKRAAGAVPGMPAEQMRAVPRSLPLEIRNPGAHRQQAIFRKKPFSVSNLRRSSIGAGCRGITA
jgi:hypothetical protein